MLINQDFTQDRSKYLGGSDVGAILGLSPYKTPLDVWLEKTGKHSEQKDSLPLRFGSFAESFVASEYARATANSLTEYPKPSAIPSILTCRVTSIVLSLRIPIRHYLMTMAPARPVIF